MSILARSVCRAGLTAHRVSSAVSGPPRSVRSVLHVSLVSHKPFMLSRLFRDEGIHSEFLALNTDLVDRLTLGYDHHLPYRLHPARRKAAELRLLWTVLARFDVIHFHFNTLLSLDDGWELPYLRRMGKVLAFQFRGCDLRQRSVNMAVNPDLNCCRECDYPEGSCDTDYQRNRIEKAKRHGDLFFVTTPDLRDFLPEAEHIPFIPPYGIDLEAVEPVARRNGVFRIVTSSNHPGLDGVPHLRAAVNRLKGEGESVELVEVIRENFREALRIYKSADLFAGKLTMGYYNNANIETMLMGIPNMTYIRASYLGDIPDCPIIVARPETIYGQLKEWLSRRDALRERGALGSAFVAKYHDPKAIVRRLTERYSEALRRKRAERTGS
jgi:hypothetical protein